MIQSEETDSKSIKQKLLINGQKENQEWQRTCKKNLNK